MRLISRPSHIFLAAFLILSISVGDARASILDGPIRKEAIKQISKALGKVMGTDAPLKLDAASAFASTTTPKNFRPHLLTPSSTADLSKPLAPGDYVLAVTGYCTALGVPNPHQGLGAKMAMLQGRQAKVVADLLMRGTLANVPPTTLQAMVWRIEDGLPVTQWPTTDQAIVHQLIPEQENTLKGDRLQQVESIYSHFAPIAKLPSFDELLVDKLGEPGKLFLKLKQARQLLADTSIANERLPALLFQQQGNEPVAADGEPSPWSEIQPGIIARFTTLEGAHSKNRLEFRVLPSAVRNPPIATALYGGAHFQTVQILTDAPIQYFPSLSNILYGGGLIAGRLLPGLGEAVPVIGAALGPLAPVLVVAGALGAIYIAYSLSDSAQQPLAIVPYGKFESNAPEESNDFYSVPADATPETYVPGSLKRSPSWSSELAGKTYSELKKMSGDPNDPNKEKASKMKKLMEQVKRLLEKNKGKMR